MNKLLRHVAAGYICLLSNSLIAQNLGIGTNTPLQKLHIFTGPSGATFTFSPVVIEGSGNSYVNFLTPDASESGIFFGKANHSASGAIIYNNASLLNGLLFRTNGNINRMVLTNNGFLGIGNLNPAHLLDVNGRMRIRSGGNDAVSAGIWFNDHNQNQIGFVGMENNNFIGLFGNTTGWKFSMNVNNGALKVNGNSGIAGDILQSNGPDGAAAWMALSDIMQIKFSNTLQSSSTLTSSTDHFFFTTHNQTITVNRNARLLINVNGVISAGGCPFDCLATDVIALVVAVNGTAFLTDSYKIDDFGYEKIRIANLVYDVGPGTHTVTFEAKVLSSNVYNPDVQCHMQHSSILILPR